MPTPIQHFNAIITRMNLRPLLLTAIAVTLSGCDNEAEKEFINYRNNEMVPVDKRRVELIKNVNTAIHNPNGESCELLRNETIPELNKLRIKVNSLNLKTKEAGEFNDKFSTVIAKYLKAYQYQALRCESDADPEIEIKVTAALAEAEQDLNLFLMEDKRLLKKYGYAQK